MSHFDLMEETDRLIEGAYEPEKNSKPSHDTIEFNTISVVDNKTGQRRYFRLYGKCRERIRECNADGRVVVTGKPPIGWLKDHKAVVPYSMFKWYVDSQPRRDWVTPLGLGKTRMEAVYDYCDWWVNSVEVMQQHYQAIR
jgi:hypothetical protein